MEKEFTHIDYSQIPEHMRAALEGYLEYGWGPGWMRFRQELHKGRNGND